jgi:putative membrane protein
VVGFVPYCGAAPVPGGLAWKLDPILIGIIFVLTAANLALGVRRRLAGRDLGVNLCGWLVLALAFISPLCHLSVALFSARVAQHMAVALIAAPLIARGLLTAHYARWPGSSLVAWLSTFAFAAIFWIWHSPVFYDETLQNNLVYWVMHATTFVAALVFWIAVFGSSAPMAFLMIFVTGLQMSLLGALLTFASAPLFIVHEFTTAAWGLTWLQDEELGGLLMWAPAGLLLTAYSVLALSAALRELDAPVGSLLE